MSERNLVSNFDTPLDQWPCALEATIARCTLWKDATVLRETASTQDAARGLGVGSIVIAGRQTAGRGRLGRSWIDTGHDGLAMSMNVSANCDHSIALVVAVAAAQAIEDVCRASNGGAPNVRLKWPNDLLVADRKVGGILIERHAEAATIGIGINCSQRAFQGDLASRATSLLQWGFKVDRLELARALLVSIDRWLSETGEALECAFAARDALRGTIAAFRTSSGMVTGTVLRVDASMGIVVRTSRGDLVLPAATTSIFVPEDRVETSSDASPSPR